MKSNEKIETESKVLKKSFEAVFDEFYYEAYLYFCMNPKKIEISEASKRAYAYAERGARNIVRKQYEVKDDEECSAFLKIICRRL